MPNVLNGEHKPDQVAYVFIANDVRNGDSVTTADDIAKALLTQGFWAFTAQASLHKRLAMNDPVLIYLAGGGRRHFIAHARIAAPSIVMTQDQRKVMNSLDLTSFRHSAKVNNVQMLNPSVSIGPLIDQLTFIRNKAYYGLNLRQPVIRIPQADYHLIVNWCHLPKRKGTP